MNATTTLRLIAAGWHPNRDVWDALKLPGSFEPFPEAQRILSSFGGLMFGNSNEYALLEPSRGDDAADQIHECENELGRRLYPIGCEEHQDREYLLVDEAGTIYFLAGDTLHLLAPSFEAALDYIALRTVWRRLVEMRTVGKLWQLTERP